MWWPFLGLATALVAYLWLPTLLRFSQGSGAEDEPCYSDLGTRTFRLVTSLFAGAAGVVSATFVPHEQLPAWLVLSVLLVILVAIDAQTTWLPIRLHYLCVGLWLAASLILAVRSWQQWLVGLLAGLMVTAVGYLAWRFGLQVGFGDIRLLFPLAAASSQISWQTLWLTFFAGSLIGALWGIAAHFTRGNKPFAYGPGLASGLWVSVLATPLLG